MQEELDTRVWLVWCCEEKGYVATEELLGVYSSEELADASAAKHAEFVAANPAHAARECSVVMAPWTLDK